MTMAKLKPCPFCGHSRNLTIIDMGSTDRYVDGEPNGSIPTYSVYCGYCGATGPEKIGSESKAVEAWNIRDGECDADE